MMTYKQAKALATKSNAGEVFTSDAGNGWTSEVFWCASRKRQIWTSINPDGLRT